MKNEYFQIYLNQFKLQLELQNIDNNESSEVDY